MEIPCEQSRFKDDEEEQVQPSSKPSSPQSIASSTNSPSHEFSFTISLPPSSLSTTTTSTTWDNRTKSSYQSSSSPFAIDLSPADDIFSHGRLLPLHSISHIPVTLPPRSSTSSIDSFTNPFLDDMFFQEQTQKSLTTNNFIFEDHQETRQRVKSKSFSLFGLPKWKKTLLEEKNEDESKEKRKLKFDNVSHFLKRYIRMVRPFLSNLRSGNTKDGNMGSFQRQSYSPTGLSLRGSKKKERRGGRRAGEHASAPASIWTSPTNSGHLVATPGTSFLSSSSNSSMEDLQNAIQAAIAHCKNSISVEDNKIKL